ncbi:MAG: response regulator transcription factor [Bdellovibrionaceae bacterium]|nr:response regulator transcription factor [Pseudobdellovibrionaceae bacterium]MBX3034482.1 response regulator transcription factor [Pseudobdellovibrionaceae bacterium]
MTENPARVLVVEDEREIRELMALHLLRQGYKVRECVTAEEAMGEVSQGAYSLVILDWMLPGLSGLDFLDYVKRQEVQPSVLMVTARTEPSDIVQGLEKGADDFLSKPFEPSVFMARVKALLRRLQLHEARSVSRRLTIDGLTMNFETYEISLNDEKLHLTPSEFKLLSAMLHNRGKVMTRDQLIDQIQGEGINVVGRTIDTHVFGLRKKLGEWSDNIETIRGVGYRVKMEGT